MSLASLIQETSASDLKLALVALLRQNHESTNLDSLRDLLLLKAQSSEKQPNFDRNSAECSESSSPLPENHCSFENDPVSGATLKSPQQNPTSSLAYFNPPTTESTSAEDFEQAQKPTSSEAYFNSKEEKCSSFSEPALWTRDWNGEFQTLLDQYVLAFISTFSS